MIDWQRLWAPRSVAVVGASGRDGSLGQAPVRYLLQHGYPGAIFPVNPSHAQVCGMTCYPSVAACPGPVDLALVMVGADRVPAALADCAAAGAGFAVVLASGFAEAGAEGRLRQAELVEAAAAQGLTVVGPNCIGLVNPHARLVAGFSPLFARAAFRPGEIGLVTQSGALGFGIVSLALERDLHFSRVLNTGNEAALTTADAVSDLLADDVTRVILVYAEELRQPERWRELARLSRARGKAIAMLKVGRSQDGARAAASHTAALAGDDRVLDAVLRQLSITRAADIDELLDLAAVFRQPRLPRGPGAGIVTTSGGAGIMAADGCAAAGLTVAELGAGTRAVLERHIPAFGSAVNPVDVTAQVLADRQVFRTCLAQVAADPAVDLLLAAFCVLTGESADRTVEDLLTVAAATDKPVLVSRTGADALAHGAAARLQAAGVPVFATPARAARAAGALAAFAAARALTPAGPAPPSGPPPSARTPAQSLHRLPLPRQTLATTAEEAVAAAAAIGFPVVLKIASPDIPHKTEAGGVRLGLTTPDGVRTAFTEIITASRTYCPGARLSGVLVQEQIQDAVELLLGITPSPFGPLLTVGAGGILVEILQDTALRLLPIDRNGAAAMLDDLKVTRLLRGARGRPHADEEALIDLIMTITEFATTTPGRWELDLNPVAVLPRGQGVRVLDHLLITHEGGPHGTDG
ncbi:MAG: hypothetical protein K0R39_3159 [Symbiobacteriaceae bacterium]|nr:hypothetical protein [Symbiobacteriaceae bacterium]